MKIAIFFFQEKGLDNSCQLYPKTNEMPSPIFSGKYFCMFLTVHTIKQLTMTICQTWIWSYEQWYIGIIQSSFQNYPVTFSKLIRTNNSVFRENRCPPPNSQFFYCCDLEIRSRSPNLISSFLGPNYISMKVWQESNNWFTKYCTDKKGSHHCQKCKLIRIASSRQF